MKRTLARRVVGSELPGVLRRTLEVPLGQRAVLLDGGRYVATLPSGRHKLEGWQRGAGETAVLVDDSAISLLLGREELSSSDHHQVRVALELGLRVTTPEVFVAQRTRDRGHYTLDELQSELGGELLWVVEELVTSRGVGELTHAMGRERLRLDILTQLQPICERSGLLLERLVGLRVEAPDHTATKHFEEKARKLRAEYEHTMASMQGGRARLEERLRRENLELEHDIASRRKVAEQKLEERRLWFEQQHVEQTFARQEQMKKLWEMARIHEMHQERKQERRLAQENISGKSAKKGGPRSEPLGQRSFQAVNEQAVNEKAVNEQAVNEKAAQEQAAKEQNAASQGSLRSPRWRRCPGHGIKYDVNGGDCPLCEREQRTQGCR